VIFFACAGCASRDQHLSGLEQRSREVVSGSCSSSIFATSWRSSPKYWTASYGSVRSRTIHPTGATRHQLRVRWHCVDIVWQQRHNHCFRPLKSSARPAPSRGELSEIGAVCGGGAQVQGQVEQPRVLLVSVPYAMKAADAETVGGLPPSSFVLKPSPSGQANEGVSSGNLMAPALAGPIGGGGTTNYIPIWTSNTNLGNSTIYQSGSNVGIGTTTPTSMLTVAGSVSANSVNATTTYQIGGSNILSTAGRQNLFLGQQAGQNNTSGVFNVFAGYHAGSSNTTGGENSFFGHEAGNLNATGSANTFLGNIAGQKNASGADNTFLGARAGANNTSGNNNTFAGFVAGYNNTTGSQNVFLGNGAGQANTTGQNNTLVALVQLKPPPTWPVSTVTNPARLCQW